jgi:hypothetical protein
VVRRATAVRLAAEHLAGAHLVLLVVVVRLAGEVVAVLVVEPPDGAAAVVLVLVLVVGLPAGEVMAAAQLTAEEMDHEQPMVVVTALVQRMVAQRRTVAQLPMAERHHMVATTETAPHMVVSTPVAALLDGEVHQGTNRSRVVCLLLHRVPTTLRHQAPMPLPRLEAMAHTLRLHPEARPWMLLHRATIRLPRQGLLLHLRQVVGMSRRRLRRAVIRATIRVVEL